MIEIYGLKTCETCRKVLKEIPNAVLRDVRADGVPSDIMAQAFAEFGEKLLNTRSTTWRGLEEAERAKPSLELIAAHPALMKRPLIKAGDTLFLGWTAQTHAALNAL